MTSVELLEQSLSEAIQIQVKIEKTFLDILPDKLNRKPNSNSWSAAECFQHLLFTNASYLKSFKELSETKQIGDLESSSFNHSSNHAFSERGISYKHSLWGKLILHFVNPNTKMKSKTTKTFNPSHSKVETNVVKKYLSQHDQLIEAIGGMKRLDLKKMKIPSPINSAIKYNLGDAIRIIILHDQRHIQQAERAIKS